MTASARLAQLGVSLPTVPAPAAAYQPYRRSGPYVYTAGQLPLVDGELTATGLVGDDLSTDEAATAAEVAGLNVLAAAAAGAGGIDHVRMVKLTVFVAAPAGFTEAHLVANGASGIVAKVLGDNLGAHARSAVAVASLPLGAPVEVEAIVEVVEDATTNV